MHAIQLDDLQTDKALTQAVVQITQFLGLYQAEAARVLGVQCADIGACASAQKVLQAGKPEWNKARQFVRLYEILFTRFAGDSVAIYHWLRARHPRFGNTPLLLLVDEGKLDDIVVWLESTLPDADNDHQRNTTAEH